ncbi:MAG: hypothetical protein KC486_08710 [Myxococcales bacterium]|nr:hypothetical protein [Myxococcales bacterium]
MKAASRTIGAARALASVVLSGLLATAGGLACSGSGGQDGGEPPVAAEAVDDAPLRGGLASLDAVAEAALAGLAAEDRESLAALLIDGADFRRFFAELSNHPSAAQMGPDLIWDMQSRESADELDRALRSFGGRSFELRAVEPEAVEPRGPIVIHRRPALRVVDREGGEELRLQLLGSVIEHRASGTFALVSYRVRG